MLFSYLKLAFRLMMRNAFFTIINMAGLSVGFTAFCVLWPYAQSELSSDRFHKDYEYIAKLSRNVTFTERGVAFSVDLPMHNSGIARQFARDYPEIIDITGFIPQQFLETYRQGFDKDVFVSVDAPNGERIFFREQHLGFADPNFFQFFSFPLEIGDPGEVLREPNTAVVSSSHAKRYFGETNPIDKTIYLNDSIPITIKGVFKDFPRNTHMIADALISTAGINQLDDTSMEGCWFGCFYLKLARNADIKVLADKINEKKNEIYKDCPRCPLDVVTSVLIHPLARLAFDNLMGSTTNFKSRYLLIVLSVLAFAIPSLAWINYISLSIHMFRKRLSEIGVRKTVGASMRHFATQFMVEAILLHLISLGVAFTLIQLIKIPLELLFGFYAPPLDQTPLSTIWILLGLFAFGIAVTIAYPLIISLSQQSGLLVRKKRSHRGPAWINAIVTMQYGAAIVLLIWIVCLHFQLKMILSTPVGVKQDGLMVIDCPLQQEENFLVKLDNFTSRAASINGILGITVSKSVPGDYVGYGVPIQMNKDDVEYGFNINGGVDHNFLRVYGLRLICGRNFQPDMPSDKNAILLSRDATEKLGFITPETALGARLILPWFGHNDVEVIGIYEDYEFLPRLTHLSGGKKRGSFLSYKSYLMPDMYPSKITVRVDYKALEGILPDLEKLFNDTFPHDAFYWTFLDENVQKYYAVEKVARNQIAAFTLIAIAIACMGLLGLVSNKVAEKTKEIGIRKALGASLPNIAQLLLHATTRQIMVAVLISIPVAYVLVVKYLERFSDRITLEWWHFAVPVVALVLIMSGTIVKVVLKAAKENPVEALKHE